MINKYTLLIISIGMCFDMTSQISDFENYEIDTESFLDGSDQSGGFSSANIFIKNQNFGDWWTDWALSNVTDNQTPGLSNQFASFAGGGAVGSSNYAVSSAFNPVTMTLLNENDIVNGLYITNSTYSALSMLNGDDFGKAFGGLTGDDPDFFIVSIQAWFDGVLGEKVIDFYLADFRFEDNAKDYIVNDWQYIDLTNLGQADSLQFTLSSSDVGDFGMNTPAFFCVDDVVTSTIIGFEEDYIAKLDLYPNPVLDYLTITGTTTGEFHYKILNFEGQLLKVGVSNIYTIDVNFLEKGYYLLSLEQDGSIITLPFAKT